MQLHNLTFFWDCLRVISDSVAVLSLWFGVKVFFLLTINELAFARQLGGIFTLYFFLALRDV